MEKKLVHNSNKRGVEGGKISEIDKRGGWIFVLRRVKLINNKYAAFEAQ